MNNKHSVQSTAGWILLVLALPLLWWVSAPARQIVIAPATFVFWHNVVELFTVIIAMLIFVTGYRAILSARKGAVVLLGIAFFGVGLFDFLHVMSAVGMPDAISSNSPNKTMFFWLVARALAASALLVYVILPPVPNITISRKRLALALMLAIVCLIGSAGLLSPDRIPALFVHWQGPTHLRISMGWMIIAINLTALAMLWLRRQALTHESLMALGFAIALSSVSELFFTKLGIILKDGANVIGHLYKVAAYLYLFHVTVSEALRRPLERIEVQHLREKVTLDAAPDGVLWVDKMGYILMANPAMEQLTGYSMHELVGQNVDIFLPAHHRARYAESMRSYFVTPHQRAMGLMDLRLMRRNGEMLPIDISLGSWDDEGECYAIAYIRDLTERKKFEESLRHQATHDELTGLPNRWLYNLQLNQAIARAGRSGLRVAVLFLDLDYFKNINDSFGHSTGDALLVQVGARIRSVLRENDTLARMGGDEFAIMLTDLTDVDAAVTVATKLLLSLQASYHLQNQEVYSGGSLGLAFYPDDANDSDTLLRFADMAMYQAKNSGRGSYACYSVEMDKRAHENMRLHARLKEAILLRQLKLHYQPLVEVASGKIIGAEALLRWHDSELGHVSPAQFIPVAEATGLILTLSEWVLETACEQIAAWSSAGVPLRVSVNFSTQQFLQRNLSEYVSTVLTRTGAQPQLLDIEITESVAMAQPALAREQIIALVVLGCSVALDDFGTGYSSLAYLKALPVSKLKIDKNFMDGIPDDVNDVTISRTIITLAHSLGLTLVAEGVETDAQLRFLRQYGCEAYQGWLFAKAMPAEDLMAMRLAATV